MSIGQLERALSTAELRDWRLLPPVLMGKLVWRNCWPSDMDGSETGHSSAWWLRQSKLGFTKKIGEKNPLLG